MRLPLPPKKKPGEDWIHFLTDHYIDHFGLTRVPFTNADDNAYLKFYNDEKVRISGMKFCNSNIGIICGSP